MKLLGRDKLTTLQLSNQRLGKWLRGWSSEIVNAHWHSANDVLEQFPKAKVIGANGFEFCFSEENEYVISTQIIFSRHVVIINGIKG